MAFTAYCISKLGLMRHSSFTSSSFLWKNSATSHGQLEFKEQEFATFITAARNINELMGSNNIRAG
jgi:hypothetical protein